MLKIFNTLTHRKEIFKPIINNNVSIYVCGITVYDFCHIGHGRTFTVFDIIIRYFKFCGYNINYVRNITDIDDKIIIRAIQNKESISSLTNRMIKFMHHDFHKLNLLVPTVEPRVTQCIEDIILMISVLIKNNYAYINSNGDVCFSIKNYSKYGELSNQLLSSLQLINNSNINLKMDFVLWKLSNKVESYVSWKSPWGYGRPGWHIECSAMSNKYLGKTFDIHGGGIDLLFPHHENEKAQLDGYDHDSFINYWIHAGMVVINDIKMSKSLNNVCTLRYLLKSFNGNTLRYFFLSTHYRRPLHFNIVNIKNSENCFKKICYALCQTNKLDLNCVAVTTDYDHQFNAAMKDDFNTPEALKILLFLSKKIIFINKNEFNKEKVNFLVGKLFFLVKILGFNINLKHVYCRKDSTSNVEHDIQSLIKLREKARSNKDWNTADVIRKKINKLDIVLEDTYNGTIWYPKNLV
ncbi:MAG: cysteine--tRNA ligase [Buchnera aphidicola (Eriosoma harunire)]